MEIINGNADTPSGLESADSGSAADDCGGIRSADPLADAETCLERAEDQLCYGRRQEAEGAIAQVREARKLIAFARTAGQGQ